MNRRTILKYTALATGTALAAPFVTSLLSGCQVDKVVDNYKPSFFAEDHFAFIKQSIDLILPKTDSPSATEVGVHATIDQMVGQAYKQEDRVDYQNGLTALYDYLHPVEGTSFSGLKAKDQTAKFMAIAEDETEEMKSIKEAYNHLRQQTIGYYLSTQEIGTNFLNYLPVPGEYQGCVSLESVGGKAWAL